jgi:uncharacterized membrane protein YphA (DoxX/SURF4 family)
MKIAGWVLAGLTGFAMLGAGATKLMADPMHVAHFVDDWGFGLGFMYFTGVVELIGAVLLIVPRTRLIGSGVIVATMLGATATHLMFAEYGGLIAPLVLGGMAAGAGWIASRPA